ncbi:MAG: DNA translocase FtsK 4TM domain-containing protein [Paludibacteraceae bacterium]|nr:DNA translocase FtsK 4TM domain-containing protein [Paludibacteraceae bacterium]
MEIDKTPFSQQLKVFFADRRTQVICAAILLAFSLFTLIAWISYFFTGDVDFSLLGMSRAERISARAQITNIMGLPGARLAHFMIDGSFGVPSIFILVLTTLYGFNLLHITHIKNWRLLFISAFWLIWGSFALGFIQLITGVETFFRWGGAHGEWLSELVNSFIQPIGTTIVLVLTLVIFGIIADPKFIDKTIRFKQWCAGLFKKKPATDEPQPDTPADDPTETPVTVTLDINNNPDDEPIIEIPIEDDDDEVDEPITGEIRDDNETIDDDNSDNSDIDSDNDANLDIAETTEVELTKQLEPYNPRKDLEFYKFPTLDLLKVYDNETAPVINQEEQQANANRIVTTLRNYGIEIEQIKATVGPTVTLYEVVPKAGVRIAKIQNLENDIMLSLSAIGIRIIAPMPGKGTVGIEVPNEKPQVVSMHSVIASKRFQEEQKMRLPVAIGRTITNEVFCFDLAKTPHLLVAGATGQGKSVGLNAIITSLLYKKHPAELKFVLVDPKMVEFSIYKPLLKHYMAAMPDQEDRDIIITDCQKVINTLNSLVIEMEDRYSLLADANCRNVEDYNEKFNSRVLNPEKPVENVVTKKILHHRYMPYLVIIIDEYGDFIMQAGKEVERPIQRLAQKARAVGMHMILATQRPDVKIVTGTIKANIPTRIAFRTQSVVDSRTVLDAKGADQLIGKGDMLYAGGGNLTRIQCAFVDTPEVEAIVQHIQSQQGYTQPYQLPEYVPEGGDEAAAPGSVDTKRLDPMFADVARYVVSKQEGSTSRLQRVFEIGYNRAGKLSDQLEATGIVGPNKGPKGRDVLIQDMESLERLLESLNA